VTLLRELKLEAVKWRPGCAKELADTVRENED
jgi:hypothetical protein